MYSSNISKSLLLVVDCQNDFINSHTKPIVSKINNLINKNQFDFIAFTKFINSENSVFYRNLNYFDCLTQTRSRNCN